ncbi:glycopeptide protein [Rhizoctonia solani 123E]|uniref:Glycopeptide protein n=1 Tax=Rhizoctonia solani 123E TaxID=1423351 RepID=A0A074S5Q2_9AGAM|nr:glycopeptide protein [Rhizoctonia solani 123E]
MFGFSTLISTLAVALVASVGVQAERHVVHFDNRCGYGTPTLIQGGRVLSTGADYVSNGPLVAAIAYLQTGSCGGWAQPPYYSGFNGERCSLLETTLKNPNCPGCGSSTDVSLIPPLRFSVTTGFGYYNGCDGTGNICRSAGCCPGGAFCKTDDYQSQRQCQANDVNLAITFCA